MLPRRAFDIAMSAIVLLCTVPLVPVIAILIKLQSPGPLFFRQLRTTDGGRRYHRYKFRSMRTDAPEGSDRHFPFGDFMRKTHIDELPQFLNVLKGDTTVAAIINPAHH